jgi:MoxR-like ATPase
MNELKKEFLHEAGKVILGKDKELTIALCTYLCSGHILIEDIPGVGKTTFAKTLAKIFDLNFSRIQFTSDLLPSDILGAQIYNQQTHTFSVFKGPLFNQFILADELNRASPKTQSSMLEAMEERQVSIDRETFILPNPFFVVATQNPNTQIGTNLLPESQLDRFMVRISLGFPDSQDEKKLIAGFNASSKINDVKCVLGFESRKNLLEKIELVKLSDKLINYILDILNFTRKSGLTNSLSPRAGIDISKMSKTYAFLMGRDFVLPEDVKMVLPFVISHRLNLSNEQVEIQVIKNVKVDQ